jgi:hypothetical protein
LEITFRNLQFTKSVSHIMNKIVTVSMVTVSMIILAGLALLGGPTHGNTAYTNQSEKEHCSDKYLPQDETRFHILSCDDIGILNNHGGQ